MSCDNFAHGRGVPGCECPISSDEGMGFGVATADESVFKISLFASQYATIPEEELVTWPRLVELLAPINPPVIEDARRRQAWSPAVYKRNATRANAGVAAISMLAMDVDDGTDPELLFRLFTGSTRLVHTTWSHMREKRGKAIARARLIVPFTDPCPADRWARVWHGARITALDQGTTIDSAVDSVSELYFLPALRDADQPWLALVGEGALLDWRTLEKLAPSADNLKQPSIWEAPDLAAGPILDAFAHVRVDGMIRAKATEISNSESRHEALLAASRYAAGLCAMYGLEPEPYRLLLAAAAGDSSDADRASVDAFRYGAQQPIGLPPDRPLWGEAPNRPADASEPSDPVAILEQAVTTGDYADAFASLAVLQLIGAPGRLGGRVESLLLQAPHTHRAALRRAAKATRTTALALASTHTGALKETEPDPNVLPFLSIRRSNDGSEFVLPHLPNMLEILDRDRRWVGRIKSDTFERKLKIDEIQATDSTVAELVAWVNRAYGCAATVGVMYESVRTVGDRHQYSSLSEYLTGLVWDGEARLDRWLVDYAGCEDDEISRKLGSKFLIGAVARGMNPGSHVDSVLVFAEPRGGAGKTRIVRILGGKWHSETPPPIGNKDALLQLAGIWFQEMGEMSAIRSARDIEAVKNYITTPVDTYRPPYGRCSISFPRSCVFIGTTNTERFMETADRRWWARKIVKPMHPDELIKARDQLFAEAVVRYLAGESWWLSEADRNIQQESADEHRAADPWESHVAEYVKGRRAVTSAMVLVSIGKDKGTWSRHDEMRVTAVLRLLGWTSHRETRGGIRGYWWTPSHPSADASDVVPNPDPDSGPDSDSDSDW